VLELQHGGHVGDDRYLDYWSGSGWADHGLQSRQGRAWRDRHRARQAVCRRHQPDRLLHYKGFLFDIGGHRFFSKSREVVALWNEILPDDFLTRPRLSRIYYAGKFYAYPLKAFEALRNLGLAQSIACLASYAYARAFPVRDPKTFHQWMRNEFGERLYSIFFKTYTEKVWGMDCDEISADWAAQRIKGLNLSKASPMASGVPWD
jgi:protoporphyrinogen oxidase